MRKINKLIVFLLCISIIFSFISPITFADDSEDNYEIYFFDGIHTIYDEEHGSDMYDITVYCMNNQLNWPHTLDDVEAPLYSYGYLENGDIANYDEMIEKLEKVLYAGYPFNGKGLYSLINSEEIHVPTESEFNKLLIPSLELIKAFPELGKYTFTLDNCNEYSVIIIDFFTYVFGMNSTDSIEGLTKSHITSMPFFKALMCAFNSSDPCAAFAAWYSASYYVNDVQAYEATQLAVWKILCEYGVEYNNIEDISSNQLAVSIYDYANSNADILEVNCQDLNIEIKGDFNFTKGSDGKYYSGKIMVEEPLYTDGFYEFYLPEGMSVLNVEKISIPFSDDYNLEYTLINANTEYTLVSDTAPSDDDSFYLTKRLLSFPEILQYSPAEEVIYNDKSYQHMIGIYLQEENINADFYYSDVATGEITISKEVIGNTETEDTNTNTESFNFTLTLLDSEENNSIYSTELYETSSSEFIEYTQLKFENGVAKFSLEDNESLTISGIPVGTNYIVEEDLGENKGYSITSENSTGTIQTNIPSEVKFTNTKISTTTEENYGSLLIEKKISNSLIAVEDEFNFVVTLDIDETNTTVTCDGLTFENGTARFTLKDGESKLITNIPEGTKYTVTEETTTEYDIEYTNINNSSEIISDENSPASGTITSTSTSVVSVNNIKKDSTDSNTGILSVKQTVTGNAADTKKEFLISIDLSDKTLNGTYGEMEFINGSSTFNLIHDNPKTAIGLPDDITYSVTEYDSENIYTIESPDNTNGTISTDEWISVEFLNILNISTGNIYISKKVVGDTSDTTKDFSFTLTLSDKTINGTYGDLDFTDGVSTFTLKHNESKTASNIPEGTTYEVVENNSDGYTVESENETGTVTANNTNHVEFTNTAFIITTPNTDTPIDNSPSTNSPDDTITDSDTPNADLPDDTITNNDTPNNNLPDDTITNNDTPDDTITDNDISLNSNIPNDYSNSTFVPNYYITDDDIFNGDIPVTRDSSEIFLWISCTLSSSATLVLLITLEYIQKNKLKKRRIRYRR